MKIIEHKARDVKSGETVLDRSARFIIKEVRVGAEHGLIALIDMEGVWHGVYHPDEYLGKVILQCHGLAKREPDRGLVETRDDPHMSELLSQKFNLLSEKFGEHRKRQRHRRQSYDWVTVN